MLETFVRASSPFAFQKAPYRQRRQLFVLAMAQLIGRVFFTGRRVQERLILETADFDARRVKRLGDSCAPSRLS
jgi:hypothetical protein